MMITLIKNEMIKLFQRKKTLVVTIAFALLVAFIGFGTYKVSENMKEWNKPERRIQNEQNNIENLNRMKNDPNIPKEEKERFQEEIKISLERIEEIKKEEQGVKPDWRIGLREEVKNLQEQLKDTRIQNGAKERIKADLMTNQYLLDNNIQPESRMDITSTMFIRQLFGILGAIFLVVGVIIFTSDMVSGECTPPTMKFLLTQPVSRGKVLLSKFIAITISASIIIVLIELLAFLIMGLIFDFGSLNYPVATGTEYMYDLTVKSEMGQRAITAVAGSTIILPMWKYIIQMFLLQVLFIVAATSFAFLLSTVVKSSMVSMAVSTVTIIALTIFQSIPYISKFSRYFFTTYGTPENILTGSIAMRFANPNITMRFSIIVLLVWIVVSYIISHISFTKKDILI